MDRKARVPSWHRPPGDQNDVEHLSDDEMWEIMKTYPVSTPFRIRIAAVLFSLVGFAMAVGLVVALGAVLNLVR